MDKKIDELNETILAWWQKLPNQFKSNYPALIHDLNKEAEILFVGLNPAGREYLAIPDENISKDKIKEIKDKEKVAIFGEGKDRKGQYKNYYGLLSNIADELEVSYEHYDLFHMIYSPSEEVLKEIFKHKSKKELKANHCEHLKVFDEVLKIVKPKVVITNNINTANILKEYLELKLDNETLMYKVKTDRYYYLSGIMSYGRQTEYDRERLMGLVKKVLK